MAHVDQYGIACAYIRGGTSKALFFYEKDLPAPGPLRDTVFKRLMGTPDAYQIDGMGGATTHTSKIALISPSSREDVDVDFTFVQVLPNEDKVSYHGNCGNISSAVGPFALDEGLVKIVRKGYSADESLTAREVRIYNTNTKSILISHVVIDPTTGFSLATGGASIAGVPGTGSPILMEYSNTVGGHVGRGLLPSGNVIDHITMGGKVIEISVCDVGNYSIFARAEDVGLTGSETASRITSDSKLLALLRELRGKGAQLIGKCTDWELVDEQCPGLPFLILVASPSSEEVDLNARVIFANRCHDTMPGTGAICVAAASRVEGSIVWKQLSDCSKASNVLRIGHPAGTMPVFVKRSSEEARRKGKEFETLSFERTSRRIMTGTVFVPKQIWAGPAQA
ncbi:hypothetical protein H2200_007322 [Cladophialophora chaetospira]|uniref:PrpF protein n=1 Tax=Cladophialophora chaetospira TaxID=386627 RepID=A0AA38X7Q1_9EURO|nr:hypothetical protein H2200_007322 [Cladophialophora chaetospira]